MRHQPDFLFSDSVASFVGPHEIHVTVDAESTDPVRFRALCHSLGVKALAIANETPGGVTIPDLLTASHGKCTSAEAIERMIAIAGALRAANMQVVREKIETVPWHPYAPGQSHAMPSQTYFESHIGLHTQGQIPDISDLGLPGPLYISRNSDSTTGKIFATYRNYHSDQHSFQNEVANIAKTLTGHGLLLEKADVEFALYDDNIRHDQDWLEAYT
ncbi:MAG TPA: hypothetical protein VG992_01485 [Candidatus Saccharimonadales bacterium]|nr:hypothetical protein [Candidatus Saccharimonadales bacterium]